MALSLSMINDSINSYNKKIDERNAFISNANKLIDDATMSSKKLGEASDNLALGLTIGGKSVDGGKLSEMASNIDKNITTLSNSITLASSEIKTFTDKVVFLEAEKRRIINQQRLAALKEEEEENSSSFKNAPKKTVPNLLKPEIM